MVEIENSGVGHRMVPGSHERPGGAECVCGGAWDRWMEQCVNQKGGHPVDSSGESPAVVELPDDARIQYLTDAEIALHRSECIEEVCPGHGLKYRKLAEASFDAVNPLVARVRAGVATRSALQAEPLPEAVRDQVLAWIDGTEPFTEGLDLLRQIITPVPGMPTVLEGAVAAERQRAAGMVQQFFKDHRGVDWGDVIELTRRILAAGSVPVATPQPSEHREVDGVCRACEVYWPCDPYVAANFGPVATPPRPEIVVLCGSTRFKDAFREAARENALAGRIVLTVSDLDPRPEMRHVNVPIDADTKQRLDELHKRKIDMADRVLVLNVGGYVGESTRSEIEYATAHGKPISYLETGPRLQPGRVGFGTDAFDVGGSLPGQPVPTPTRARRYDQCDGTCTVDCGHCKGQGRPVAPRERVTCLRCGYFVDSDAHERTCGRAATPTEPAIPARLMSLEVPDDAEADERGIDGLLATFDVPPGHAWPAGEYSILAPASPVPAEQPDGWGEGVEAVDHPVNCGCASCVIDRLRESNDSLREQLSRAVDEIDGLRAEQPEGR